MYFIDDSEKHFHRSEGRDLGSGGTIHLHINLKAWFTAMFMKWKIHSSASLCFYLSNFAAQGKREKEKWQKKHERKTIFSVSPLCLSPLFLHLKGKCRPGVSGTVHNCLFELPSYLSSLIHTFTDSFLQK